MSVNFLFILLGVVELSLPETLAMGCAAILVQCFHRDRPQFVQVVFNVCGSAWAVAAAYQVYDLTELRAHGTKFYIQLIVDAINSIVGHAVPIPNVCTLT